MTPPIFVVMSAYISINAKTRPRDSISFPKSPDPCSEGNCVLSTIQHLMFDVIQDIIDWTAPSRLP